MSKLSTAITLSSVAVIDTETDTLLEGPAGNQLPVGLNPRLLTVSLDGSKVFVPHVNGNVTVIDVESDIVV